MTQSTCRLSQELSIAVPSLHKHHDSYSVMGVLTPGVQNLGAPVREAPPPGAPAPEAPPEPPRLRWRLWSSQPDPPKEDGRATPLEAIEESFRISDTRESKPETGKGCFNANGESAKDKRGAVKDGAKGAKGATTNGGAANDATSGASTGGTPTPGAAPRRPSSPQKKAPPPASSQPPQAPQPQAPTQLQAPATSTQTLTTTESPRDKDECAHLGSDSAPPPGRLSWVNPLGAVSYVYGMVLRQPPSEHTPLLPEAELPPANPAPPTNTSSWWWPFTSAAAPEEDDDDDEVVRLHGRRTHLRQARKAVETAQGALGYAVTRVLVEGEVCHHELAVMGTATELHPVRYKLASKTPRPPHEAAAPPAVLVPMTPLASVQSVKGKSGGGVKVSDGRSDGGKRRGSGGSDDRVKRNSQIDLTKGDPRGDSKGPKGDSKGPKGDPKGDPKSDLPRGSPRADASDTPTNDPTPPYSVPLAQVPLPLRVGPSVAASFRQITQRTRWRLWLQDALYRRRTPENHIYSSERACPERVVVVAVHQHLPARYTKSHVGGSTGLALAMADATIAALGPDTEVVAIALEGHGAIADRVADHMTLLSNWTVHLHRADAVVVVAASGAVPLAALTAAAMVRHGLVILPLALITMGGFWYGPRVGSELRRGATAVELAVLAELDALRDAESELSQRLALEMGYLLRHGAKVTLVGLHMDTVVPLTLAWANRWSHPHLYRVAAFAMPLFLAELFETVALLKNRGSFNDHGVVADLADVEPAHWLHSALCQIPADGLHAGLEHLTATTLVTNASHHPMVVMRAGGSKVVEPSFFGGLLNLYALAWNVRGLLDDITRVPHVNAMEVAVHLQAALKRWQPVDKTGKDIKYALEALAETEVTELWM